MTHGQCDARPTVTFPASGHHRPLTVPNYTAWWQRHMCVNNLPKVVTWQCHGAESNLRPWVTSVLQVRHVTVRLPSHTFKHWRHTMPALIITLKWSTCHCGSALTSDLFLGYCQCRSTLWSTPSLTQWRKVSIFTITSQGHCLAATVCETRVPKNWRLVRNSLFTTNRVRVRV